jgi:hypothetical protein
MAWRAPRGPRRRRTRRGGVLLSSLAAEASFTMTLTPDATATSDGHRLARLLRRGRRIRAVGRVQEQ